MNGRTMLRAEVPFPGGDEAVYEGTALAYYRHGDWLGTAPLVPTPASTIYYAGSHAPYGESYGESGAADRDFTGMKQDIAVGNYDFLMREYPPVEGRWFTPDPRGPRRACALGRGPAGLAAVDPDNPHGRKG